MPFFAKRHFTIMKSINPKFFFIPVISFVFIIGVIFIGIDVRFRLKEVESRANTLSGLSHIQKDLNLFIYDVTYYRNIATTTHLLFLAEQKESKLIKAKEINPIITFLSTLESHVKLRKAQKLQTRISILIDGQRKQLRVLSQELKISWITIFLMSLLGCLLAIAGSILSLLFAKRSKNLVISERKPIIAIDNAEERKKIKYEFLTIVSHELKTYLNVIIGLTNLIQDRNKDQELEADLEMLRLSNQGLKSTIDNSIDLGDIEKGMVILNNTPIRLSKYIKSIVHSFIPSARQNKVDIHLEYDENIPLEVSGDPFRLNQILFNLIKNAIKFGTNGLVIISTKLISNQDNIAKIRFSVIDNAIGIDPVKTDKIFESFSQVNERITENYRGGGIGLSIIKNLLIVMNSEIQLKSKPGQGSMFYFELDMEFSETSEAKKNPVGGPVLIVDDNKINRILLSRYLDVLNIRVDESESADDAILACKKTDYRIILMDLQMPIIDGVEATKIIREQKSNLNTAIFAVSSSSKEAMKLKCKGVDFTGFIPKPIDRKELIQIVSQYC
jgi:signal transduction histidine kinase/CheY-like chemotaxis protein